MLTVIHTSISVAAARSIEGDRVFAICCAFFYCSNEKHLRVYERICRGAASNFHQTSIDRSIPINTKRAAVVAYLDGETRGAAAGDDFSNLGSVASVSCARMGGFTSRGAELVRL